MKFSQSWLREWVKPDLNGEQLAAQLTMAGLEVEGMAPVAGAFSGVVVGEITEVTPHPDAEKLRICLVRGQGTDDLQVVCGAPNARPGIKVPFATVGAELPGGMKIQQAKLRGKESYGMLCGADELGVDEEGDGLWELPPEAPVGEDLRHFLGLDDVLVELDLTPNRGDCLSIRGLAREVSVLNQAAFSEPAVDPIAARNDAGLAVQLSAADACPSYAGRVIQGIDAGRPSPAWLVEKLRRSGIRSIDAVVDVTNFVLLELGQPMHAFDLDKLQGGIDVRLAREDEEVELLDGQTVSLKPNTLVIADESGAIAMAGIMGGASTAVSTSTKNIFLESAFFAPTAIVGRARSYGLHTESSHRFERGVDFELQVRAIERATELLLAIVGGEPGPVIHAREADHLPTIPTVSLSKSRLATTLGLTLPDDDVEKILTDLGLLLLDSSESQWHFQPPSFRFDLQIEADLVEEVARVYGYDRLPKRLLQFAPELTPHSESEVPLSALKGQLVSRAYQEVVTYSFIDPKLHKLLFPDQPALNLANPISSDMATMRTSLLPGLLQTLKSNLNRQQTRVRLFESGLRFETNSGEATDLAQEPVIAGLIYGPINDLNWASESREVDFFDLKGDLESVLALSSRGRQYGFRAVDATHLHPGQAAEVLLDDQVIGEIGALHPSIAKALGLSKPVFLFECRLGPITQTELPHYQGLSRFPAVSRDLAVVVDQSIPLSLLDKAILETAGENVKELKLFDLYCGEGIDPERKSLAFSLTFQHPSRTLKDDEINASMSAIFNRLEQEFAATLR